MRKSTFIFSVLFLCATLTTAAPAFPESGAAPRPRKIGLVLSGGGARGAAHIGVLKVLEREGIPIDCIAGTSFGALIGGLYALGYSAAEIEKIFTSQDWDRLLSDAPERRLSSLFERRNFRYQGQLSFVGFSPELPSGLLSGQKMIEVLDTLTTERMIDAGYDFDRLRIPFRAVATDLLTGQKYVFKGGRMTEALRASVAIPMIFTPVDKDGMLLVDGGLADNLPADIAHEMGADFIIAVDATSPMLKKTEVHNFFDVFDQSVSLMMRQNIDSNLKLVDFTIQPGLDPFTYRSYGEIRQIEQRGEQEAERRVAALKVRLGDVVARQPPPVPPPSEPPVVASISFRGLKRVPSQQLQGDIRSRVGEPVDPQVLNGDIGRLYATRLFENVDYSIDPLEGNRYRLAYLLTESAIHTLGASIRYDRDYKFVALAEFTARQIFGTPSTLTLSSQFGGLDEHSLSLRYVYPHAAAFYLEPKVHYSRLDRLDIRNEEQVDTFTDKRIGGQLMLGGTFFKRLDVAAGYREDDVTIDGGADPNRQAGSQRLAGLTLRVHRDSLDSQEFARSGTLFRFQADKRTEGLGSDVSNSKYQASIVRYFPVSEKSTVGVNAVAGYSRGTIPFYDRLYSGGFSFSELGPQNLIGFARDELPARQMAIAAAGYRWRVFSHPLSFARRGFLFGVYNIAAMSDQPAAPYDFHYFNGGGIGFAADTLLGPARITVGWGSGGKFNLYLSMGPAF